MDFTSEENESSVSFIFPCSQNISYSCSITVIVFLSYIVTTVGNLAMIGTFIRHRLYKKTLLSEFVTFVDLTVLNVYSFIMTELSKCPGFILHPPYYAIISVPTIVVALFLLFYFHCAKIRPLRRINYLDGRHVRNMQSLSMTMTIYVIVIVFIVSQIPYLIFDVISI